MIKVIIAGSRDFNNYDLLKNKLNQIKQRIGDFEVVSGCARGADKLGEQFANEFNLSIQKFPANWEKYGKKAGFIRNEEMAKYANGCIVFWNQKSKGTENMINLANQYDIPLQ